MTIKNVLVTSTFLLAMSASLSGFAESKPEVVDGDTVTIECISANDVEAMTEEEAAKLILPICEDMDKNES